MSERNGYVNFGIPDQVDQLDKLSGDELRLLLQLARVSFERGRKRGGYLVGGIMFEFKSERELDDLIDDTLAVIARRRDGTTAA